MIDSTEELRWDGIPRADEPDEIIEPRWEGKYDSSDDEAPPPEVRQRYYWTTKH